MTRDEIIKLVMRPYLNWKDIKHLTDKERQILYELSLYRPVLLKCRFDDNVRVKPRKIITVFGKIKLIINYINCVLRHKYCHLGNSPKFCCEKCRREF